MPLSVRSPACRRISPSGIPDGVLLCMSEMQTNAIKALESSTGPAAAVDECVGGVDAMRRRCA